MTLEKIESKENKIEFTIKKLEYDTIQKSSQDRIKDK